MLLRLKEIYLFFACNSPDASLNEDFVAMACVLFAKSFFEASSCGNNVGISTSANLLPVLFSKFSKAYTLIIKITTQNTLIKN